MPKFTLKTNPNNYWEDQLRQLVNKFKQELELLKERADKEISEAAQDALLK